MIKVIRNEEEEEEKERGDEEEKKSKQEENLQVLTIVKKSKFHKKERTANLEQVKFIVQIVDHPNVDKVNEFYMNATNFFFVHDGLTTRIGDAMTSNILEAIIN